MTVQTVSQATATLTVAELEALIRRVVREEVARALKMWGLYEEPTIVEPGSPVHKDLVETLRMAEAGTLQDSAALADLLGQLGYPATQAEARATLEQYLSEVV